MTTLRRDAAIFIVIAGAILSGSAFAHHSRSEYDNKTMATYEGTVSSVNWANPHVHMSIEGAKAGVKGAPVEHIGIETAGPVSLGKIAWSRNTIKVGDKVTVTGNPNRKGTARLLLLYRIILPDGKELIARGD